jgi:hypothetical protein
MAHARRWFMVLVAWVGVTALAGCAAGAAPAAGGQASAVTSRPASSASAVPSPQGVAVAAFHALARQEASDWPRSPLGKVWKTGLVIPSADYLTSVPSRGFSSGNAKLAFGKGELVYTGPPPSGAPAGVVTWPGGSTTKVPVLSEAQAFSALKNNTVGRCAGCRTTPVAVTGARPATMAVPTSRGKASVPAWEFTVNGALGPVFRAAIPPGSYVLEDSVRQPAENLGPLGKAFVGITGASLSGNDGRTLRMTLASGPCGPAATWGGLVAEVGDVVVVGGWVHDPHPGTACAAVLIGTQVTVRLAAPLGDRVILDAATGLPVAPFPFRGRP